MATTSFVSAIGARRCCRDRCPPADRDERARRHRAGDHRDGVGTTPIVVILLMQEPLPGGPQSLQLSTRTHANRASTPMTAGIDAAML
jgi:hypothetical protein